MPSRLSKVLTLLLCLLIGATTTAASQENSALSAADKFPTQVAEKLRDSRPDVVDKPIHWLFVVDTSRSMLGKSSAVNKMLRNFLEYTVVPGDKVSRIRFGAQITEGPDGVSVSSGRHDIDLIVEGLDPVGEGKTVAGAAQQACKRFVESTEPSHARVAVLVSDDGANDGDALGSGGATADFRWQGKVTADREKVVDLVVTFWVEGKPSVAKKIAPSVPLTRKVAEKEAKVVIERVPEQDPDGNKRRAFETVPWIFALLSFVAIVFALICRNTTALRVVGKSAELKLPWWGSPVKAAVDDGSPAFHLPRDEHATLDNGTTVVEFAVESPFRLLEAASVKAATVSDPISGEHYKIEVDRAGFDYRGRLHPGKNRLAVKSHAGIIVRDVQVEVLDTKVRFLLLGIVALAVLWIANFVFQPFDTKRLRKPIPAQPAQKEWVPRPLVDARSEQ